MDSKLLQVYVKALMNKNYVRNIGSIRSVSLFKYVLDGS